MADGSAELKIVVRAVDATRSVLDGIGRRILGVLLKPIGLVANAVRGIVKQFFSLKGLLLGGGIIGAIGALTSGLAKNAKAYEPIFSPATQQKIDDTASAFSRLGASLKKTFAEIVVEFKLDEKLNYLSDWLRDNQAGIIQFFRDMGESIGKAASFAKDLLASLVSLPTPAIDAMKKAASGKQQDAARLTSPYAGIMDRPLDFSHLPAGVDSRPTDSRPSSRPSSFYGVDPLALATIAPAIERHVAASKNLANAQEIVAEKTNAATAAISTHHGTITADIEVVERAIIATEEYADTIAGNFTDAFFDAIEGTKTFARAFSDMTISIIRDIGRLLVFRSIFGLVAGALTPSLAGSNAGNIGGLGEAGGTFGAGFEAPYGFAGGGRASSSGAVRVGEQGPETVFLPRGARVNPAHREGGMGGGITINVVGARDARATATEVVAELRRNGALRAAVRTA